MKYTIPSVLDKINKWYFEFLPKDDVLLDARMQKMDESREDGFYDAYDEEALMYVCDKIMELSLSDYEEFSDIVSLLTLEYFNIMCNKDALFEEYDAYENEFKDDTEFDDEEILDTIRECNKEDFVDDILDEENDYLVAILSLILEYYDFGYVDALDFSSYDYGNMDNAYKSDIGKNVYEEFHPNLSEELNHFNKQKKQNQILETIRNLNINSLLSFVCYIKTFNQYFDNKSLLISEFTDKLMKIKEENKKLYNEILCYVVSYFYMVIDDKQNNNEELSVTQRKNLEYLKSNNLKDLFDNPSIYCFITQFINYDFMEYDNLLNNSSNEVKSMVKKLTMKNS